MTLGKVVPGGTSALAPAKNAHQGVSTGVPHRATRSEFHLFDDMSQRVPQLEVFNQP